MATSLSNQIQDVLPKTQDSYYKLILAVGPTRAGKTAAISELAARHKWPRLNVNLYLSEKLLELTHRQRAVRVAGILDDSLRDEDSKVILLDNIELLFATELAQDPLKLLQSLARNRTIVAAWPGSFDGAALTYAGHCQVVAYGFQGGSGYNFKLPSRGNSRSTDRRRLFGRGGMSWLLGDSGGA